jgi:cold shock protein
MHHEGIVKWFNSERGYGVIEVWPSGDVNYVYVHVSEVSNGCKFLEQGQRVGFHISPRETGQLQAVNVVKY